MGSARQITEVQVFGGGGIWRGVVGFAWEQARTVTLREATACDEGTIKKKAAVMLDGCCH